MARPWPDAFLAAALGGGLAGCGLVGLHNPAPDFTPGKVTAPWRIHCETARTYLDEADPSPWPHGREWVWARDERGLPLVLDGETDDGFVVVRGVRVEERGKPAASAGIPATAAGLRAACEATLARLQPGVAHELGKVRGARDGEELNAPLLFPDDAATAGSLRRVVVFGDSLSDTGKLRQRLHAFPRPPYWMGRFSNGPVWTDYFEWQAGVPIQHHAYGGATAGRPAILGSESLLASIRAGGQFFLTGSLEVQVQDYLAQNLLGKPLDAPRETAFVIWAGANDYVWKEPISGAIGTFLNEPKSAAGYERVVDDAVAALGSQVEALHAAGARRFVLLNLPDLGRTPIVLQNRTYFPKPPAENEEARKFELSRRLTKLTAHHNRRLAELAVALRAKLPGSEVLLVDTADALDRIEAGRGPSPSAGRFDYGFDPGGPAETIRQGERSLRIPARCYHGGYTGTSNTTRVCADPARAMFWDVLHPTSLMHCWQAFTIQKAMAKAGWTAPPPAPDLQRERCLGVVERENGGALSLGLGAPLSPPGAGKRDISAAAAAH